MKNEKKYGFIGAGKMASAIVKGMISQKVSKPSQILCTCGNDTTGEILKKETKISLAKNIAELLNLEILILACKPQQLEEIDVVLKKSANSKILISILAGVSIKKLRREFPNVGNIIRVMPNLPAQISEGISCYSSEKEISKMDKLNIVKILTSMGDTLEISENKLDAVTALSGSGPGYVFEFANALIMAGKKIGFSEHESKMLTYKTLLGSAKLLIADNNKSAKDLRDSVCSKGGTTLAGLEVLTKKFNLEKAILETLRAAKNRAKELGK